MLKVGERSATFRKLVPASHGLRKSFSTLTHKAGMDIINRRMLEGHSVGIDDHYVKPTESELLEEYRKAIDLLTINPENRLQRKVKTLEIENNQIPTQVILDQMAEQIRAIWQELRDDGASPQMAYKVMAKWKDKATSTEETMILEDED